VPVKRDSGPDHVGEMAPCEDEMLSMLECEMY